MLDRPLIVPALLGMTLLALVASASHTSQSATDTLVQAKEHGSTSSMLSVHGVGTTSMPAESLSIQITYRMHEYYGPGAPRPSTSTDEQLIEAVADTGIAHDMINVSVLPYGIYGPYGMKRLTATLESPGSDQVQQLLANLVEASTEGGFEIIHVGGKYYHGGCQELEETAFEAAMVDASERAHSVAGVTGLTVGAIVAISDDSLSAIQGSYGLSACDAPQVQAHWEPYMVPGGYPVLDPAEPAEVTLVRVVHVTFAAA